MTELARSISGFCCALLITLAISAPEMATAASKASRQQNSSNPAATWNKLYATFSNYPATLIATSDAGYLITGTKLKNARSANSSLWVIKTDRNGKMIWEKEFSPLKNSNQQLWGSSNHGYAAIETSDGYLVTGSKDLSSQHGGSAWNELWLIKVAKNGALLWEKGYGCQWGTNSAAGEGRAIQQTDDGGLIVSGFGSVEGAVTAWLLKLDRNGNRKWEKFLGAAENSGGTAPVCVAKATDGYIYTAFTTPASHVVIIKLDPSGTIVWRRQIDQYRRSSLGAVAATSDGGLILAGSGDDDGLLLKIDSSGTVVWHKTYGKNSAGLFSVTADRDNGFIAAGGVSAGKAHLWILQTDNQGVPTKDQEIKARDFSTGKSVTLTSDGGYAISASNDKGNAVWLIKLDASGTLKR